MVFTLHRYIFRELIRVFVLAAVALTAVLTLASMLRPIQEFGVGPEQALHLLGYFIPIVLTVVLPISALFSAALVYGRFASDNELDACKASGISLMTLVYPGLCLAVAVSITTLILSFYVVPAFVHRAEKSVKANAKQIVFRNIMRKGYYEMPPDERFRIYADKAIPETDTLEGVVVVESKDRDTKKLIFAKTARIIIESGKNFNEVTVIASQGCVLDENGNPSYFKSLTNRYLFPPMLSDDIKFQKIGRLKQIRADMSTFEPVRKVILTARTQLATELLAEDIAIRLARPPSEDNYYQFVSEDRIITFHASACGLNSDGTINLVPPVELLEYDPVSRRLLLKWNSDDPAMIKFESDQLDSKLAIVLENASWERNERLKGSAPTPRKVIQGILLSPTIATNLSSQPLIKTVRSISSETVDPILRSKPSNILLNSLNKVEDRIWRTSKTITAEIHTRLVFGIGCITLVLFAIALGIIFKGGHILSAFGASAIPAGILVTCMMSGRELTKTKNAAMPESTGVMVMWAGLIILSIAAVVIYRKLTKT